MEKSRFLVVGAVHMFLELPLWTVTLYSQLLYPSTTCDPWVTVYQIPSLVKEHTCTVFLTTNCEASFWPLLVVAVVLIYPILSSRDVTKIPSYMYWGIKLLGFSFGYIHVFSFFFLWKYPVVMFLVAGGSPRLPSLYDSSVSSHYSHSGLCSSRAWWPLVCIFIQIICWVPWILHGFRTLGSLQFSLEHSLEI